MQGYAVVLVLLVLLGCVQAQSNILSGFPYPNINIPTIPSIPTVPSIPGIPSLPTLPTTTNTQTQACSVDCGWNTIDVNGAATINVNPDIATLNLQVMGSGKTNNDALTIVSQKITSVLTTLSNLGLTSANWQTTYLNVYPNTSYVNGAPVTYGQIATQTMTVTVPMANSNGNLVGQVYDGLAQIKDISINGLTFDLQDKTAAYGQARKQAYQDAVKRATDYTSAAGVTLGIPVTITDSYSSAPVVAPSSALMRTAAFAKDVVPTTVSVGTVAINYNVEVVFSFA